MLAFPVTPEAEQEVSFSPENLQQDHQYVWDPCCYQLSRSAPPTLEQ